MSQKFKTLRESGVLPSPLSDLPPDVLKAGVLRKLKKMKRKFFILRKGSEEFPSKLEYYPSEKKWRFGSAPKHSIPLKSCFNISRKLHPKHKFVICLYTLSDCFSIVLENEEEMNEWLSVMVELQTNEMEAADDEGRAKPVYEHIWQVVVDDRELEFSRNLSGPYCLGLTANSLSLIKISSLCDSSNILDFPLMSIRRCGHSGKHFFIELGRSAITGAGGMWMETEGTVVAQNMHETILSAMKSSKNKEESGPLTRPRSASTSENTKPIATRRPVGVVLPLPTINSTSSRERSDTMPPRPRTISDSLQDAAYSSLSGSESFSGHSYFRENTRPHSVYAWPYTNSPTLSSFGFTTGSLSTSLHSNGSNISFDDLDSPQNHMSWCTYTPPSDINFGIDAPIREAQNEYLMMSPTDDNMNIIPQKSNYLIMNPNGGQSSDDKPDSVGCSPQNSVPLDYMDMKSPSNSDGYIPMSAVGSLTVESSSSLSKKRSSNSLNENSDRIRDGYVPMAPCGASEEIFGSMQDGYLSMSPLSTSLPKQFQEGVFGMMSLNGSSATIDDASEFKLDKVQSLLKQTDADDDHDFIKPVRTYSIGSRSQIYESRVRAYSMGSERTKSECRPSTTSSSNDLKDPKCVSKSCSAPVLQEPHTASAVKTTFEPAKDYGSDLMEIDYRKPEDHVPVSSQNLGDKKHLSKPRQRTSSRSSCSTLPLLSLDEINERAVGDNCEEMRDVTEPQPKTPVQLPQDYVQMGSCKPTEKFEASSVVLPSRYTPQTFNNVVEEDDLHVDTDKINVVFKKSSSSLLKALKYNSAGGTNWKNKSSRHNKTTSPSPVNPDISTTSGCGEYVNLFLNKPRKKSPPPSPIVVHLSPKSDAMDISDSNDDGSSYEPNYINIKLGKHYTPLPNLSLVTLPQTLPSETSKDNLASSESYKNTTGEDTVTKTTTSKPKSFGLSSFPVMRKQMSAPTVPPSLQPEVISPGRKSSCPVTGSVSMVKSALTVTSSSSRIMALPSVSSISSLVKRASMRSSDPNNVSSKTNSPKSQNSIADSNPSQRLSLTDLQYENVCLPVSSGSSRPSSVSSEKELNYASLDLAPMNVTETPHSPLLKFSHQTALDDDEPLAYAEIDFTKSEGLRNTSGAFREGRL